MANRDDGENDGKYESSYGGRDGWYRDGFASSCRTIDVKTAVEPLLRRLREIDALRVRLETQGGHIRDLASIAELLTTAICMQGFRGDNEMVLSDPSSVRRALFDIGDNDLHLDVRQLDSRMPVYYLCRVRRDYWSEYSLIVEDLYCSPGYPMLDERFVRLMYGGHETYYLRLSQFRLGVEEILKDDKCLSALVPKCLSNSETKELRQSGTSLDSGTQALRNSGTSSFEVDATLYDAGRHVLQAAWHDDQRTGILAATRFGMPRFRNAIELLYLCLSGELCELRGVLDDRVLAFFERVYPQPAILRFLKLLPGLDGGVLSDIPQKAFKLYVRLSKAFGRFIELQVTWGACGTAAPGCDSSEEKCPSRGRLGHTPRVPLYKLIFGNISRLDLVAKALRENKEVNEAAARLDAESEGLINELLAVEPSVASPYGVAR